MQAEIKYIENNDDSLNPLSEYIPNDIYDFIVNTTLSIGVHGETGSDLFYLTITTRYHFAEVRDEEEFLFDRSFLFVHEYNYEKIEKFLQDWVGSLKGETWHEIALQIAKYTHWEFDGYHENK